MAKVCGVKQQVCGVKKMNFSEKKIERYFKKAKEVSKLSDYDKTQMGAVLVCKNKIISVGFNHRKSNPIQYHYNKLRTDDIRTYNVDARENYIHCEIDCVLKATNKGFNKWSEATLFIYRETKNHERAIAKPCLACEQFLKDKGINNIYYTVTNNISEVKGVKKNGKR